VSVSVVVGADIGVFGGEGEGHLRYDPALNRNVTTMVNTTSVKGAVAGDDISSTVARYPQAVSRAKPRLKYHSPFSVHKGRTREKQPFLSRDSLNKHLLQPFLHLPFHQESKNEEKTKER